MTCFFRYHFCSNCWYGVNDQLFGWCDKWKYSRRNTFTTLRKLVIAAWSKLNASSCSVCQTEGKGRDMRCNTGTPEQRNHIQKKTFALTNLGQGKEYNHLYYARYSFLRRSMRHRHWEHINWHSSVWLLRRRNEICSIRGGVWQSNKPILRRRSCKSLVSSK